MTTFIAFVDIQHSYLYLVIQISIFVSGQYANIHIWLKKKSMAPYDMVPFHLTAADGSGRAAVHGCLSYDRYDR